MPREDGWDAGLIRPRSVSIAKAEADLAAAREELAKARAENARLRIVAQDAFHYIGSGKRDQVLRDLKTALTDGDNRVGEVVKAARKVVGAPAGPLPSELFEALKELDGALADLDGAAK